MSSTEEKGKQTLQRSCDDDDCSSIPKTPSAPSSSRSEGLLSSSRSPTLDGGGPPPGGASKQVKKTLEEYCGRERLKRHRVEMAGRVCIPETWEQESLLKDWADRYAFESFMPEGLASARKALIDDCRRANTCRLEIENRC